MESYLIRFLTYMFAVWWGMLIERDSYTDHMNFRCSLKNYHVTHPPPYSPEPEPLPKPEPLSEPVIARYQARIKAQAMRAYQHRHPRSASNTCQYAYDGVCDVPTGYCPDGTDDYDCGVYESEHYDCGAPIRIE